MHRFAPFHNETSVHDDAMHWVNYFTLHIKLRANGELEYVPEFNDEYFQGWYDVQKELSGCREFDYRGQVTSKHQQSINIVNDAIAKVRMDQKLTLAEISLLEDVYIEISGCKRPYIYY